MRRFHFLILFFLILPSTLLSQTTIQIRIKQAITKKAKLFLLADSIPTKIDSTYQLSGGIFRFFLPEDYKQGIYRLELSSNIGFDFIVSNENDISIETVVFAAEDSLQSIKSDENEIFFRYNKFKKKQGQQLWYLNSLKDFYSDTSTFKTQIKHEIFKINSELNRYQHDIINSNPGLLVSTIVGLDVKPLPPLDISNVEYKNFILNSWWNTLYLKDSRITDIPSFKSKILGYLELLFDEKLDKEEQDKVFIDGAKRIFNLEACPKVMSKIKRILFDTFYENDYHQAAKSIDTYNQESGNQNESFYQNKEFENTKLDVGDKVFDFKIKPFNNKISILSKIKSKYKLVIFWSIWCPHCMEMMPELNSLYKTYGRNDLEVVAVSIDSEQKELEDIIIKNNYEWINTIEPDDGSSKVLKRYSVSETPELYLIDYELKIISRPQSINQLKAKLKKLIK